MQTILELVTDGLMLCPPNPNFIQARDAIMQAVVADHNCTINWDPVWSAFVTRGMGWNATAPDSLHTSPVVESFAYGPVGPCQT